MTTAPEVTVPPQDRVWGDDQVQLPQLESCDFFHTDTVLGRRLYALAYLEHGTRRLHITGVTANPTRQGTLQQARNLAADLGMRMESLRFLFRDRDGKYGAAFDAIFEAEELDVIKSAARAPRMNAHCERIIGGIRREVLDHVLILNEAHARQALAASSSTTTNTVPTRPPTSYHQTPTNSPRQQTSAPAGCCAPGSSAASSTSTDTPHDLQRRLFERHRLGETERRQRRHRAPSRPHNLKVIRSWLCGGVNCQGLP
ncbi:hypothetical protein [Streptomyces sp. NPDC058476]|uniref:hypothetical protein n=1 Tax=Streptomyces sp. NPDC058476 TaxID=3346519 RepID=UPI0036518CA1